MPFRDLISRLKSVRKRRDEREEVDKNEGVDDPANPSIQDEASPTAQNPSQPSGVDIPKPITGLRKASPSNAGQLSRADRHRSADQAEPSDYLYFGEGLSPAAISQSLQNQSRRKSENDAQHLSPTGTHNFTTNSGKDSSGFLRTELNTHTTQMGYSSLTYGGSLQYDYAGTQG